MARPKLSKDKSMIEDGVSHINRGILIGNPALDLLKNLCLLPGDESKSTKDIISAANISIDEIGVSCYFLVQGIELLIKGLITCFGELPLENHSIKTHSRTLMNIYRARVPEMAPLELSFSTLTDNRFTGVISTWQILGRYEIFEPNLSDLERAREIFNDLVRFTKTYQLTEVRESYDFF